MIAKRVCFVETEGQFRSVDKKFGQEVLIVAMKPEVDFCAAERGLKYVSIDDFYDSTFLMAEGSNNFTEQEAFCESLDRMLEGRFPGLCSKGFFASKWFLCMLKRLRDSLYYKASVLTAAFDYLNPEEVVCFMPGEERLVNIGNFEHWLNSSESIILDICKDRKCAVIHFKINDTKSEDIESKWNRKRYISGKCPLAVNRSLKLFNIFMKNFRYTLKGKSDLPVIAISQTKDGLFDFTKASSIWGKRGGKIINLVLVRYLYNISLYRSVGADRLNKLGINSEVLTDFFGFLSKQKKFTDWFSFKGVNCFPIAQIWLKSFITKIMPEFISYSAYLEDMFRRKRVGLFICTAIADPLEVAEAVAARRSSVTIISSEHGGIGSMFLPIYEYQDYRPADFSFRYGRESVRFYNDEFKIDKKSNSCVLSAVGSVPLEKMFKKERSKAESTPKKQKTLLYIPTGLVGDQLYFAWNHYPDIWYWRFLKDIILLLKTYPDINVLFKEYPFNLSKNPIKDFVRSKKIEHVNFISAQSPTEDNLGKADLIVMDFPSTSLMGALCTRKPIILFCDPRWLKMANSGRGLLEKRVEFCDNKDRFLSIIKSWCDKPYWPEIKNPDDSYLKAYGIIDEGHDSAREQIKQINNLLRVRSTAC